MRCNTPTDRFVFLVVIEIGSTKKGIFLHMMRCLITPAMYRLHEMNYLLVHGSRFLEKTNLNVDMVNGIESVKGEFCRKTKLLASRKCTSS